MDRKCGDSLNLNFAYLFEGDVLEKLLQTKDVKPKQFCVLFEEELLSYLNDTSYNYKTTIKLNEFFDIVKQKCENENYQLQVIQAFEALDYDCQGHAHIIYLEDHLLKCRTTEPATFLEKNFNSFSYSTVIPGPIDVFDASQDSPLEKIVDFSYRNRCEFKKLLPRFSRKLLNKFELRTSILEILLQEFYCRAFKKSDKIHILEGAETTPEIKKSELEKKENVSNDPVSVLYIWLLKFISSISSALMAVNPSFAEEALNHVRWALDHLDFFQLSGNHKLAASSSSGLSLKGVVDELRSLSHQLTKVTHAQEIHLWIEFVCGDVSKILDIILSDSLPTASPLIKKLKSARNQIFQKESSLLEELRIESDGVLLNASHPDKIRRYASRFNSTCLHILSEANDQLAINHLKIMVGQDDQVIKVFVCQRENFKIEDLRENSSSCTEEDLGLEHLVTLTASDSQRELKFSFGQPIIRKKILIKVVSNRGQLTNMGVGFYGLSLSLPLVEFANKAEEEGTDEVQMQSLLFLSCAAACKSYKVLKMAKNKFNFSTFSNAFLNEDTGVLNCKTTEFAKVVAMEPLTKEHPSFEIEVLDGKNLEIFVGLVGKDFNQHSQLPGFEPWSLAFHGESGGIHEGNTDAKAFKSSVKANEKLKWRIEFGSEKNSIIFERDGDINYEKEIPESIGLYPALALRRGAKVKLLNKEPWRSKKEDDISWLNIEDLSFDIFLKLLKKYEKNKKSLKKSDLHNFSDNLMIKFERPLRKIKEHFLNIKFSMLTCALHLLHNMLPFMPSSVPKKDVKELLNFLCGVVDSQSDDDDDVIKLFQKLLAKGVKLFFSEEDFQQFDLNKEVSTKRSSTMIFEALCRHIGDCEPHRLLSLPDQINDHEKHRVISSMQKIVSYLTYKPGANGDLNPSCVHLLCSLQALLFAWCSEQMSKHENEEDICALVCSYIALVMDSTFEEVNILNNLGDDDLESVLKKETLLSTCFRQLLVLVGRSCDWWSQLSKKNILEAMRVIYSPFKKLILKLSDEKWGIFCETSNIHWFYDVTASFFHLMGRLCGSSIQIIPDSSEIAKMIEGKRVDGLLSSDIWRLIFRAGLQISSKQEIQRSLSGKHGAVVESEALGFLLGLNEEENTFAQDFIKRCQKLSNKMNLAGGAHVNSAVIALFAALVWHTQPIRESLESYIASDFNGEISEGILHAYKAAEILRLPIMKKRQDLIEEKLDRDVNREDREEPEEELKEDVQEVQAKIEQVEEELKAEISNGEERVSNVEPERIEVCENCPIADMKSKSEFLLKFAGLQKMQDGENKKVMKKGTSVDKTQNLKQSDLLAMYPSFQLVLNFVKDPQWTQTQIESLLESRKRQAIMLSKGFRYATEFLVAFEFENISSRIQKSCMPVFFAGLLEGQTSFSKHHLDSLDGCGLMMESKVRQEFYRFFKMLTSTSSQLISLADGNTSNDKDNAYYNCIITATLHVLDVNWQIEDFKTVIESGVVDFLLSVVSGFRPIEEENTEDWLEEELKIYSEHMQWLTEVDLIGINDFKYPRHGFASKRNELDKLLFVSRYQLRCGQEYRCDFCREVLSISENGGKAGYYRCTECNDFDICTKCVGQQIWQEKHMPSHKLVHLKYICKGCKVAILNVQYKCNQCPEVQWCTGCVYSKKFNHEQHTSDHILSMEKLPPVSHQKAPKACLASYNQRHAALQLSNLSLRSLGYLTKKPCEKEDSRKSVRIDVDYQSSAEQLYEKCIVGVVKILLERNSNGPLEPSKDDGKKVWSIDDILFGLLARLLPTSNTFMQLKVIWTNGRDIIKSLLEILTGCKDENIMVYKLMTLALLKRIFQLEDFVPREDINSIMDTLMEFGSQCLHSGQLKYCSMVIDTIRVPVNHYWRNCLISRIEEKIMNFDSESDKLVLIFHGLVLVGFPKFQSFGSPLNYFSNDESKLKKGILLKSCVSNSYEIFDMETRRKEQVEEKDVVYSSDEAEVPLKLPFSLLGITESIFQRQEENPKDSELLNYFLSLLIKVQSTLRLDDDLSSLDVVLPRIVHSFLNGNKLSRMLTYRDIENLIANLATLKGIAIFNKDESLVGADPLADIEDLGLKLQFETMSQDDNILNPYICRAIYNLYKDDRVALANELMNTVTGAVLSDEVKESLNHVELTYKSKPSRGEEAQLEEDLDVAFDLFGLRIKEEDDLMRKSEIVMEEGNVKPAKLMSSKLVKEENRKKQGIETMKKNESLIKVALEKARLDEEYKKALFKKATDTLMGISCRQFLTFFFLNTNFEEVLKINLMKDSKPLSSPSNDELWCSLVIFLLTKGRDEVMMRQMLSNVLSTSSPKTLELFINVAHNFMLDLTFVQYVDLKNEKGFVEVHGSESLMIQFPEGQDAGDESVSLSESRPHLLISSSSTFDPLMYSLPICSSMSVEIQSNKFYHKMDGECINRQFLVMRKIKNKELQSAGLEVFQQVISDHNLLRKVSVGNLWVRLLKLFYELTSTKRIKILSLILRISTSEYSEALDFSLLNHAWTYYKKLVMSNIEQNSKVIGENISKPAVFLGLTELFASLASNTSVSNVILVS